MVDLVDSDVPNPYDLMVMWFRGLKRIKKNHVQVEYEEMKRHIYQIEQLNAFQIQKEYEVRLKPIFEKVKVELASYNLNQSLLQDAKRRKAEKAADDHRNALIAAAEQDRIRNIREDSRKQYLDDDDVIAWETEQEIIAMWSDSHKNYFGG